MYREESSDLIDKIEYQELLDTCINTHKDERVPNAITTLFLQE